MEKRCLGIKRLCKPLFGHRRSLTELYFGKLTSDCLLPFCGNLKIVLIADAAIQDLYAEPLAKKLGAELLTIEGGEQAKTLGSVQSLIDALSKMGCGRDTLLIAMGGGVTTDLVGFVSSIYMRGIPLILIPTTLLAIVDAAVGGKTGVDTSHGKNLIGTFYYPRAIFADIGMLQTLPEKEWFNGLAEILKMGLIYDPAIWKMAEKNRKDPDLILQAIKGKIAVVEQDPQENGMRRILNFGHTVGHALETVSEYAMSHGEAVAIGCVGEAHLSFRLGYLLEKNFEQILDIYNHFPLRLPKRYDRTKLLSAMAQDKKKERGEIRCVLIDAIGHAVPFEGAYCRKVALSDWEQTLDWMENWKSFR